MKFKGNEAADWGSRTLVDGWHLAEIDKVEDFTNKNNRGALRSTSRSLRVRARVPSPRCTVIGIQSSGRGRSLTYCWLLGLRQHLIRLSLEMMSVCLIQRCLRS